MSKGAGLRETMARAGLVHLMAASNPLAALIAEEAGFEGIWASGFEFSALLGLPDVSLVSMTQHLEMLRQITARTALPVVADIDTGFGNAINVMHTVREYERAGAAGVVIEDKTFPKVTSLFDKGRQELVRVEEFQGKIEAAIAARADPGLLVIARVEALIAGLGEEEAERRAALYVEAGADMILIHSKQATPDEVESFVRGWSGAVPLAIVPTSYPMMDERRIRGLGKIGMVIYGNHAIRASVAAMQEVFAAIRRDGGTAGVEARIAPVAEVFRLQGMQAVKRDEARFLR
ncbi:MAG: phosphonopyruvate hydrolase [Acetobacteraceae bacterium]